MKNKTVIINSTPLISLSLIENLSLLDKLFRKIIIPSEVAKEVTKEGKPKSLEIKKWINGKIVESKNKNWIELFSLSLDLGESEVLALYYEITDAIVIIDEEKARKLAKRKNIPHIGTLGILLLAKKMNLIEEIKPLLEQLKKKQIRISEYLYSAILISAGEL
ncbi:MAG: DUF3368 domain-containing protein [Desulfamplus sp.]|nr:DUF3368 domain-containing protein [Desulfamplus sp.]